jgi:hypothetical protein
VWIFCNTTITTKNIYIVITIITIVNCYFCSNCSITKKVALVKRCQKSFCSNTTITTKASKIIFIFSGKFCSNCSITFLFLVANFVVIVVLHFYFLIKH